MTVLSRVGVKGGITASPHSSRTGSFSASASARAYASALRSSGAGSTIGSMACVSATLLYIQYKWITSCPKVLEKREKEKREKERVREEMVREERVREERVREERVREDMVKKEGKHNGLTKKNREEKREEKSPV